MNWLGKLALDLRAAEDEKQALEEKICRWKNESKRLKELQDQVKLEIKERNKLLYRIERGMGKRFSLQCNALQAMKLVQRTINLYVLHAITCGD